MKRSPSAWLRRSPAPRAAGLAAIVPIIAGAEGAPAGVPDWLWWAGSVCGPILAGVAYELVAHGFRVRAARRRAHAAQLLADGDPANDAEAAAEEAAAEVDEKLAARLEGRRHIGNDE